MRLLSNKFDIKLKLIQLISECKNMQIAVAWATTNHDVFKTLIDNKSKINKLIIGTHFYQTDPKFLEYFMDNKTVKVIKNTGDVFHPKIYYFNTSNGWECMIGSANFTNGAMNKNEEIMICITSDDYEAEKTKLDIWKQIAEWFNIAEFIEQDYIEDYTKHYKEKQKSLQALSSGTTISKSQNDYNSDIFSLSWNEYFNELSLTNSEDLKKRLKLLNTARLLFKKHPSFNDFNDDERKKIAGFYQKEDNGIDWRLFGNMTIDGLFKQQINDNNFKISEALDKIPLLGTIQEEDYLDYIRIFKEAFTDSKNRLATATRLLTMKRPDYFICLDSKNKKQFCSDFGLKENDISPENYWDTVVKKIFNCLWWDKNESELNNTIELEVYKSRVALLDKLYYNNIPRANPKNYLSQKHPELLHNSSLKIVSSRRWQKNENKNYQNNWWFKFSEDSLKEYEYLIFAGAEDYKNDKFKLLKVPTSFLKNNLKKFDVNADGLMINLYILFDTYIDIRSENHVNFKDFLIN